MELESFTVEKDGIVGLVLDQVLHSCRKVRISCLFCLLAVTASRDITVTSFERPYRIGAYVPPHILGDWDDVEASNRAADRCGEDLLLSLAATSTSTSSHKDSGGGNWGPLLEELSFVGKCSSSLKLVPSKKGSGHASLSWLHSVVNHATVFLFGMSGAELADRLIDLQGCGKVRDGVVRVELGDGEDEDAFRIVIDRGCSDAGGGGDGEE